MELVIEIPDTGEARSLFGAADRNLKALKKGCQVDLVARNGTIKIRGEEAKVRKAAEIVEKLRKEIQQGRVVTPETVTRYLRGDVLAPGEVGIDCTWSITWARWAALDGTARP